MTLSIDLTPELERRIEEEAARRGQNVADFARSVLEEATAPADDPYAGLPRRTPADLEALARQQGVKPVERFEDLLGDFWPEEENIDDFIAAVRRWRRGED